MLATTELHAWRCANPTCPSRRAGQGQIVMRGPNVVGWLGEGRCHQCGYSTLIEVTEAGATYTVRPCKNHPNG
jgi:hypothetical protein